MDNGKVPYGFEIRGKSYYTGYGTPEPRAGKPECNITSFIYVERLVTDRPFGNLFGK